MSSRLPRRDFLIRSLAGAAAGLAVTPAALADQTSASKRIRYGVVGCGNRSRNFHLPLIKQYLPEVEVAALCDITPEALEAGIRVCGSSTAGYSDYRRMLAEHPELDAVIVILPNYLHADCTVRALEAGKHVLVEKPMATHVADADRMVAVARRKNLILQVGQQSRYSTAFHRMEELIRQGAIGDLEIVFGSLFRGDWNPRSWKYTDPATGNQISWRFLTYTSGSSLLEDGIHELDVIHWLVAADPVRIQAQGGNNVFRDRETIDNAGLLIEFSNGVRCTFTYSIFSPRVPDPRVLRLFGSQGEMHLEKQHSGQQIVMNRYRGQAERISVPYRQPEEEQFWKGDPGNGDSDIETYREHKAFLESIRSDVPPFASGKVGRDAIHISLAAEHSLRTGRIIEWGDEEKL